MVKIQDDAGTTRAAETDAPVIVVGVDRSEHGEAALRWAVEGARCREASLRLVSVWHLPPSSYLAPVIIPDTMAAASQEMLDAAAAAALGAAADVPVFTDVRPGTPAAELIEAARDAALLVVGGRDHGGFSGPLLGSASAQIARHPPCPVVIVPSRGER